VAAVGRRQEIRWIEFWTEDGEFVEEKTALRSRRTGACLSIFLVRRPHREDYIVKQMNDACRLRLFRSARCDALTA